MSKSFAFLTQQSLSAAISSSHQKKRSKSDNKKAKSMIQTNNAFADYLEQNSNADKQLEIVESKLTEMLNILKTQLSQQCCTIL